MRGITKMTLLQQINSCPSDEISSNRLHFWIAMFGHEITYMGEENIEKSINLHKDENEGITDDK